MIAVAVLASLLVAALGLLAGLGFVGLLCLVRGWRRVWPVLLWCPYLPGLRVGVRLRDGSIDCPCGIHVSARQETRRA